MSLTIEDRLTAIETGIRTDAEHRQTRQERLDGELSGLRAGIERISKQLFGNGIVDGSIVWRLKCIEDKYEALSQKVNTLFKTDDWRRDVIAGIIKSVVTAVLVGWFVKHLIGK